jgi:hypothetical protein
MDLTSLPFLKSFGGAAGATAVIAIVITAWRHITGFIRSMSDVVFARIIIKDEAASAITAYVNAHGRRMRIGLRLFCGGKVFVNPAQRIEVVSCEGFTSEPCLIRIGKKFFVFGLKPNKDDTNVGDYNTDNMVRISTIRGFFDLEQLILDATEYYNQLHRSIEDNKLDGDRVIKRFKVVRMGRAVGMDSKNGRNGEESQPTTRHSLNATYEVAIRTKTLRLLKWDINDIGVVAGANTSFNVFFFPPNVMKAVEEVRTWIKYEKWFKDKGINWRLGWLLHGKPGTGKSTLVRSIAMEFDLPVYVLDLSCLNNNTFTEAWQEIQQNSPAIALIEDVDTVFDKRVNITAKSMVDSLTFDCVLNTISGVNNSDGVFTILTTNDISKLDPALGIPEEGADNQRSTRPGRVDRIIQLFDMREEERTKVAKHVLADFPHLIEETVFAGRGESAAQFQDRCTRIAMAKFWEQQT